MEYGSIITSSIYAIMFLVLIFITAIDIKEKNINSKLLLSLLLLGLLAIYTDKELTVFDALSAAVINFLLLSFVYRVSQKAIGWGDVKLCTCISLYLGIEKAFAMLFIALGICGFFSLILLCVNKANKNKELPFAPFAAIGTMLALII